MPYYVIETSKATGCLRASKGHGVGIFRRALGLKIEVAARHRQAELAGYGKHAVVCQFDNDAAARDYCRIENLKLAHAGI